MILSTLRECRVLPVVTAVDVDTTVQLARALHRGGMKSIEITLRSAAALDSILAVQREVPEMLVAAGTVNTPAQLESVLKAGVTVALSPGATTELLRAAADSGLFFIPGAASASEVMQGMLYGFELFKFFPAEVAGGVAMLESLAGPFPQIKFCPTGGLNPANFRSYLALPNVVFCGGSWMVNAGLINQGRWGEIEELARQVMIG